MLAEVLHQLTILLSNSNICSAATFQLKSFFQEKKKRGKYLDLNLIVKCSGHDSGLNKINFKDR